jgi:hypothetical protein
MDICKARQACLGSIAVAVLLNASIARGDAGDATRAEVRFDELVSVAQSDSAASPAAEESLRADQQARSSVPEPSTFTAFIFVLIVLGRRGLMTLSRTH